ncbi:hypothetical protein CKAH01_11163 [Colletotrichum kahawae]|uniref:Uncharacterized protein n=1 Tax=Colletotrichum kahawae TaxID=34407 RepID=A0AAE0CXZ8_COLKA|nr:hypothetical protein CKAH01_11163 [Colletotrichum kahawae]
MFVSQRWRSPSPHFHFSNLTRAVPSLVIHPSQPNLAIGFDMASLRILYHTNLHNPCHLCSSSTYPARRICTGMYRQTNNHLQQTPRECRLPTLPGEGINTTVYGTFVAHTDAQIPLAHARNDASIRYGARAQHQCSSNRSTSVEKEALLRNFARCPAQRESPKQPHRASTLVLAPQRLESWVNPSLCLASAGWYRALLTTGRGCPVVPRHPYIAPRYRLLSASNLLDPRSKCRDYGGCPEARRRRLRPSAEESTRDKRNGGEKPVPVGGKSFDDMTLAIPSATSSVTATSMASFAVFVASAAASPSVTLTG